MPTKYTDKSWNRWKYTDFSLFEGVNKNLKHIEEFSRLKLFYKKSQNMHTRCFFCWFILDSTLCTLSNTNQKSPNKIYFFWFLKRVRSLKYLCFTPFFMNSQWIEQITTRFLKCIAKTFNQISWGINTLEHPTALITAGYDLGKQIEILQLRIYLSQIAKQLPKVRRLIWNCKGRI